MYASVDTGNKITNESRYIPVENSSLQKAYNSSCL